MRIRNPVFSAARRLAAGTLVIIAAVGLPARAAPLSATNENPASHPTATPRPEASSSLDAIRGLLAAREYAAAEAQSRELLGLAEQSSGAESIAAAEVLDLLVEARHKQGKFGEPETRPFAERALAIKAKLLPSDDLRIAVSLRNLANEMQRSGDFSGAQRLLERALAIRTQSLGPEDPLVAATLDYLGIVTRQQGDFAQARRFFERSLRIRRKALGDNHLETARSLHYLGIVLSDLGEYSRSKQFYEEALAIREKHLGPNHPDVAETLSNLAMLHSTLGDYAGARRRSEQALRIREANGNEFRTAESLHNLAVLLHALGDYAVARPLVERALEIRSRLTGPDSWLVAHSRVMLGENVYFTGDYSGALTHFERALRIFEVSLGPDHPTVANCIWSLAELVRSMGDPSEAHRLYDRALEIQKRHLGAEHPFVATSLQQLGRAWMDKGDPSTAVPLFEQALAIQERSLPRGHLTTATTRIDLAMALAAKGDRDAAARLYAGALPILERALGPAHPEMATAWVRYADFLVATGDITRARSRYTRAAGVFERCFGPDDPKLGWALGKHAHAAAGQNESGAAFEMALRSESIGREHLRLTARSLPERRALQYASVPASGLDLAMSLAMANAATIPTAADRTWDAVIRARGVILDEMAARHHDTEGTDDPEIAQLAASLAAARGRLANLTVRGPQELPPEHYRALLDAARQDKEVAERALADRSTVFRHEQARSRVGLEDVARALPAGSALVAFWRFDRRRFEPAPTKAGARRAGETTVQNPEPVPWYVAFVLPPGAASGILVPIDRADAIDSLVGRWSAEAAVGVKVAGRSPPDAERAYREVGALLRQRIWDPVAAHLSAAERVYVVPDGALHLVSLAALPVGIDRYCAETGPIVHYLSAERAVVQFESPRSNSEGLLAMGGVDFDAPASNSAAAARRRPAADPDDSRTTKAPHAYRGERSSCGDFASMRFLPLPASRRETAEIAALWKRTPRRTGPASPERSMARRKGSDDCINLKGAAATESAFKRYAPGRRILHLASHAFFLGGACPSVLDGSRGMATVSTSATALPAAVRGENPLLLAGLVLAGANNRALAGAEEEDGILTAEEIAGLDLQGVEWAVLSACNTGVGQIRAGEGVFGLRRAFEVAGAGTLILSLWPVQDEVARDWMEALYRARLLEGRSTVESVHAATLSALRDSRQSRGTAHPFYWAVFVAAGDWR